MLWEHDAAGSSPVISTNPLHISRRGFYYLFQKTRDNLAIVPFIINYLAFLVASFSAFFANLASFLAFLFSLIAALSSFVFTR